MNREEVITIFEKETTCIDTALGDCSMQACVDCEYFVHEDTVRDAMKAAITILKNEAKE